MQTPLEDYGTKRIGIGKSPVIGIVACIHGNETVGKKVHDWLVEYAQGVAAEIRLIFGNPLAYEKGIRFVEENLNRVFPGDPTGNYEQRHAYRITQDLQGVDFLVDFHSTTLEVPPFVVTVEGRDNRRVIEATGLDKVVVYPSESGASSYTGQLLIQSTDCPAVGVECGSHTAQTTVDTGIAIVQNVLRSHRLIEGDTKIVEPSYFALDGKIHETETNMPLEDGFEDFQLIPRGTVLAQGKYTRMVAQDDFYPILIDRYVEQRENGVLMLVGQKVKGHRQNFGKLS